MQKVTFASLLLVSLLIVSGGKAQILSDFDKPMWTMELIRVKPGMFGFTLGYLDDNWMQVREDAKRQGAVLRYERLVQQDTPGSTPDSGRNIVLLTEFKNQQAFFMRDTLFASIRQRSRNSTPGLLRPNQQDLYDTVTIGAFLDYPDTAAAPRFLSKY
jgi:hypothetical protein